MGWLSLAGPGSAGSGFGPSRRLVWLAMLSVALHMALLPFLLGRTSGESGLAGKAMEPARLSVRVVVHSDAAPRLEPPAQNLVPASAPAPIRHSPLPLLPAQDKAGNLASVDVKPVAPRSSSTIQMNDLKALEAPIQRRDTFSEAVGVRTSPDSIVSPQPSVSPEPIVSPELTGMPEPIASLEQPVSAGSPEQPMVDSAVLAQLQAQYPGMQMMGDGELAAVRSDDAAEGLDGRRWRLIIDFLAAIEQQIYDTWSQVGRWPSDLKGIIRFELDDAGRLRDVYVHAGSGDQRFDESMLNAIHQAIEPDTDETRQLAALNYRYFRFHYNAGGRAAGTELMPWEQSVQTKLN